MNDFNAWWNGETSTNPLRKLFPETTWRAEESKLQSQSLMDSNTETYEVASRSTVGQRCQHPFPASEPREHLMRRRSTPSALPFLPLGRFAKSLLINKLAVSCGCRHHHGSTSVPPWAIIILPKMLADKTLASQTNLRFLGPMPRAIQLSHLVTDRW